MIFDRESNRAIGEYKAAYAKAYYAHKEFIKALEQLPIEQQAEFIGTPDVDRILRSIDEQIFTVERSMCRLQKWKARWARTNDLPDIGVAYPMMKYEDINSVVFVLLHEFYGGDPPFPSVTMNDIAQYRAPQPISDDLAQAKWDRLTQNVINIRHRMNCLKALLKFQTTHDLIVELSRNRHCDFCIGSGSNQIEIDALGWSLPIHGDVAYQYDKETTNELVISYGAPPNPFNLMMIGRKIWHELEEHQHQWIMEIILGWCLSAGIGRKRERVELRDWMGDILLSREEWPDHCIRVFHDTSDCRWTYSVQFHVSAMVARFDYQTMRRRLRKSFRKRNNDKRRCASPFAPKQLIKAMRRERICQAVEARDPHQLIQAELEFIAQQQAVQLGEDGHEIDCRAIEAKEREKLASRGFTEREQHIILLKSVVPSIQRKDIAAILQEPERQIKSALRLIKYHDERSPETQTRKRRE